MSSKSQNPFCPFAEQLIARLYGEANAAENRQFAAHLESCPACADELASFGLARAAVADWRAADFDDLPTPAFSIPEYEADQRRAAEKTAAAASRGARFADLKNLFLFKPAMAATICAVLMIGAGFVFYILSFRGGGGSETAGQSDRQNLAQAAASPTIAINKSSEIRDDKVAAPEKSSDAEKTNRTPETPAEKSNAAAVKSPVRVSTVESKNAAGNPARAVRTSNGDQKKPSSVKKRTVPDLNDADEDEDETLRLADLFAELDTK